MRSTIFSPPVLLFWGHLETDPKGRNRLVKNNSFPKPKPREFR